MTKILNLSNDIKINKNNIETKFFSLQKENNSSTSVTFNLGNKKSTGPVLILGEINRKSAIGMVPIHSNKVQSSLVIAGDMEITVTDSSITVTAESWSTFVLIDFEGNTWS